ncbi:MAG: type II secretion system protein [Candidatus Hydrogenedentes bacterium]|nr:type II secretion system protein [Candidatus Hydrogenedentota bacterium]
MKAAPGRGFTLIELLVVIAILSILMGFVAVGLPRILESAHVADVANSMNNIRTALATYAANSTTGSFPPGYGHLKWGSLTGDPDEDRFFLDSYMRQLGMFRQTDAYDRFSRDTHDTNGNGVIDHLEFCPVGQQDPTNPDRYDLPTDVYPTGAEALVDADEQLVEKRPFVYIPVNLAQFKKVEKYYYRGYNDTGDPAYMNAAVWDASDPLLASLTFPPAKYDAYVLISVGPKENTFGLLPAPLGGEGEELYHILGLRAYFLATRDFNQNGLLDFDFRARVKSGEAKEGAYESGHEALAKLPNGTYDTGPIILQAQ